MTYLVEINYRNGSNDCMKFIRDSIVDVLFEVQYESKWNLFFREITSIKITEK